MLLYPKYETYPLSTSVPVLVRTRFTDPDGFHPDSDPDPNMTVIILKEKFNFRGLSNLYVQSDSNRNNRIRIRNPGYKLLILHNSSLIFFFFLSTCFCLEKRSENMVYNLWEKKIVFNYFLPSAIMHYIDIHHEM